MKEKFNIAINFFKKNILGIVIGALLVIGVQLVSADYSFNGTEIYYDNSTSNGSSVNVQGAVDELYSKLNYGDAVAGNMLKGKTALVNGNKITGTIESKGSETYTPTTSNQTIASGQYLSGTQTIKGDANLTAANIKSGTSIFGVTGTYTGSSGYKTGIGFAQAGTDNVVKSFTAKGGTYSVIGVAKNYGGYQPRFTVTVNGTPVVSFTKSGDDNSYFSYSFTCNDGDTVQLTASASQWNVGMAFLAVSIFLQ